MVIKHAPTREQLKTLMNDRKNLNLKKVNKKTVDEKDNTVRVGIGWLNDDCTKIIVSYFETEQEIHDNGENRLKNSISVHPEYIGQFISNMEHNVFLLTVGKEYLDKLLDFKLAENSRKYLRFKGYRYGYPRFRVWYSKTLKKLRIFLPLEMEGKNLDNGPVVKQIIELSQFTGPDKKIEISTSTHFYKYSNYDELNKTYILEKELSRIYSSKYTIDNKETEDWDEDCIIIYEK